ncbi:MULTISPECIES: hemagglutinin repeat-containing protein [unclassified Pseudomonas]|uniref:two-partner secretion domain-containing protein n=1 Tax=unclassified Pseudomonas TaxID=196821 RepID=UPI000F56F3EC|nr:MULTISPECIES: hemagglutinin repeat-containing protein [unclassified Pseudomonas]AZF45439.1 Putative large exoprotein, ShlA/HecA/FhaA family [Pseudomonas sp. R2-7-07]AZF56079.1 Putative large exoprotein, ShlA/HecA/FhaA family [Pseudomonas sp. R11-23-07]
MDVRQFAFLARQPSAALKPRNAFFGLPKRGLALILANALFWQPLLAQAEGIVVSAPGTSVGQAGNGVPVVNIATPNGAGLSHNQFQQYNVGPNGVILNNATGTLVNTQLGGYIVGNPNLKGGAASVILNEVNGGSASQLRGYTEVAGQSAKVIVANPYGITCSGCGFINTPNVTLTTGKPVLDPTGQLKSYQVDGGAVTIDGEGLNASNVDRFDIITRSAKINAQINARELNVIAGRNDVDAKTLNATPRADDGSAKPELAIDSSALGGMYAGAIKLVGTEAGVGVKLDGTLAASGGDIQLDANGRLSMAQAAATGNVKVTAHNVDLTDKVYAGKALDVQAQGDLINRKSLAARDRIALSSGGTLTNSDVIEAGVNADNTRNTAGDVSLRATTLNNTGTSVIASRALTVDAQALNNQGGTLSARQHTSVTAAALDNRNKGRVLSNAALEVSASELQNGQGGLVTSNGPLTANVGTVQNTGGEISSLDTATLTVTTLDNVAGLVTAGKALSLSAGTLDNQNGLVTSQGALHLNGNRLDNRQKGLVASTGGVQIDVASIDNRNGELSSRAGVAVNGTQLDNSDGGLVIAGSGLNLNVDQLLNRNQGLISSEGLLTVTAGTLVNRGGALSSAGPLTIGARDAVDNQGGRLVTDGTLTLTSASVDNSQQGTLSARDALRIDTRDLNNQQGGQVTSATGLTLELNRGQFNNQGGLINGPLLVLNNLKDVNNQGGEISSSQAFTLTADNLDNSGGKVLGNTALTLRIGLALANVKGMIAAAAVDARAASLDNSGGTLTSRGDTVLNVSGPLTNRAQGLINAANLLSINTASLDNQGGSLLGSAIAVDFGSATGDLNNSGGLITTAGNLSIDHLRDLNNQGGELSSAQTLNLGGRTLDNSAGKLISNNLLVLNADTLINQNGLMSGWQGLNATAASLDNRNSGTLSSRYGALNATLTGSLLNSGAGALVSQKALTVSAAELDNSDKGVLSSATEQNLKVTGLLNNANGGTIDSGTALDLTARNLDNSAGSISGGTDTSLDLLATLTNTNGKLASGGSLLINRAAQINNQGGQLASQGLLTLLTGGLDNRNRGTLAANDRLSITASGLVQNGSDGLIYSQNADLKLSANRLDNDKGAVQSQNGLTLDVVDAVDNQSGKLIAQTGDLTIKAASLDNRGGTLASLKALLQTRVVGVLRNGYDLNNNRQGGVMQGQTLDLQAGAVDNYGGRISAQGGNGLVTTGNFDNRNGGLYAKGLMRVVGHDFDNSGDNDGQIAAQQIDLDLSGALNNRLGIIESESTLKVHAASLDNQTGRLRALGPDGTTEFAIGGVFDNRNGVLETANTNLTLDAGSLQNLGGSVLHVGTGNFGIAPANLNDVGGSLVTRGDLTITRDNWTNSSVIQAGQLTVNVNTLDQTTTGQLLGARRFIGSGGNWSTNGLIASDGDLDLTLSGALNSSGRISSLGKLNLTAAQANLSDTASIAGGGVTRATISGTLNNRGRLTSATDLLIDAGALNNYATLGSGQALTVTTGALLNDHGLIFSGADMSLRVASLNNSYGDIYSMGNLSVDRDGKGGLADSIINSSSSMQSDGDLSLTAATIKNERAVLTVNDAGVYTASATEGTCIEYVNAGDCHAGGTGRNYVWEVVTRDKLEVTAASAGSSITSGGNMTLAGGDLLNSSSSIAAGGNFTARLNNLVNTGIETGETETYRLFTSARTEHPRAWFNAASALTNKYWYKSAGYNPNDLGGLEATVANFVGMMESERTQFGKVTKIASDDQRYAAVIQAGGAVDVKAQAGIDNSVVRLGYHYIGAGAKNPTDATGASGAAGYSTRITLNQQLPPDLAQQQINPLSLPGFTLPSGQGGLFRLSGASASAPASTGPQGWTLGGGNVDRAPVSGPVVPGTGTSADGVTINRVQGLPDSQFVSNPQKYLIETNPQLTNLSQFLSSDYLLSKLGYDPDQAQKRLGDGLYEQRLIQQAVIARTGQRFIDGQTSDTAMFKYLMDNAIGSRQALNLSVGVSLTAEQVAALTHDIVWMENATVAGQQVLVPVLYLAQANNRLAPNGALITGSDLSLVSGADLNNVGTLRATNNLAASAGRNMVNGGLTQAGNRLDLLAGNSLTNRAGGIIAGRDVSLGAISGDVLNERSVTSHQSSSGYRTERTDFVDNAARIEAANSLTLQAGRDVNSTGGVLKSGADTRLQAGRDVNLATAEQRNANIVSTYSRNSSATQYGTVVEAGRDFQIVAARDISAIGSQLNATRDLAMVAKGNLNLASAANEQHSAFNSKKVTSQEDHVQQVSTVLKAGGDATLSAGQNLQLVASQVDAGKEAYLVAGNDLALKAAENQDYSFYSKTKKSSSGKKFRLDETSAINNVGSLVSAGTNSTAVAGENLLLAGSAVTAEKGAAQLVAGQDVSILAVTNSDHARHERKESKSSWGGFKSSKVEDKVDEKRTTAVGSMVSGDTVTVSSGQDVRVTGSSLVSTAELAVQAGRDLTIDATQNTFSRTDMHKEKNRDLTGVLTGNKLGLDDITGNQHLFINSQKHNGTANETTLTGSTVGSSAGNVSLAAGRELKVVASDLVSTKDMSLNGSNVTIASGTETANQTSKDSSKSLAVGRVIGGVAVDTYKSIRNDVQAVQKADDSRLKAVKGAQAALSVYDALGGSNEAANDSDGKPANSKGSVFKIGTELANTRKKSTSEYNAETVKQSTLNSGGGLAIVATGNAPGTAGDLHVIGSSIKAKDTLLQAKSDVILESAQDRKNWDNQNKNNKTSIGVSLSFGEQSGFVLDLGAQMAKGMGTGHEVTQVNSTVETGLLVLKSGQDTTLAGAQVHADAIKAQVGGNLNIASRQDEASQKNKQTSGGVGVSICVPPFCLGSMVSGSANIAGNKMNSDYNAVTQQTGLYAGKGGYDINVGKNTTLQGAIIASEASNDKNYLSTDRLLVSDIKNNSDIKSQAASLSYSGATAGFTDARSGVGGTIPLLLKESDSNKTRSAVSPGTIEVRNAAGVNDLVGLNRDTANANKPLDRPDEKAMQERIDLIQSSAQLSSSVINKVAEAKANKAAALSKQADDQAKAGSPDAEQTALAANAAYLDAKGWQVGGDKRVMADIATGLIAAGLGGATGSTAVGIVANTSSSDIFKKIGDYAQARSIDPKSDAATRAAWAEGGAARVMLHALAGAAIGLSSGSPQSGALGAGASAALIPAITDALEKNQIKGTDQDALASLIAAGVGTVVGAGNGVNGSIVAGGTANSVEVFNRRLHKTQEVPILEKKAEELEKRGKAESSTRWIDLLMIAAGGAVDKADEARLNALVQQSKGKDTESERFMEDLNTAKGIVAQLAAQEIPLTWKDGTPIMVKGEKVYAFGATESQKNDPTLFNAANVYGPGAVYDQWRQYGQEQTAQHQNELSGLSTYESSVADASQRLADIAIKGTKDVTPELDILAAVVPAARGAKTVFELVLESIAIKRLASAAELNSAAKSGELIAGKNWAGAADNEAGLAGRPLTVVPGRFDNEIDLALKSDVTGEVLEGQVGRALSEKGMLLDYQSKFRSGFVDGKPVGIGEIDAETPRFIIEVASSPKPGKIEQLQKLQNNTMLNPDRKEVILFAPNVVKPQQIKAYEKVGVKVINSVEELFEYGAKKGGL